MPGDRAAPAGLSCPKTYPSSKPNARSPTPNTQDPIPKPELPLNRSARAAAAAFALLLAMPAAAQKPRSSTKPDISYARARVYPALVNITVVMRYFSGGRAQRQPGGGSGVIVTPQGHVLTNFHVAGNTTRIYCTLLSGEAIEASVVTHDPATDLSVLKLKLESRADPTQPIQWAPLGNSDDLQVGETVIAMGNPHMLASSLTVGVVSNAKRVFTDFTGTQLEERELEEDEKTGMFTRWIQHDALIQPGNSGGPLVNLRGEVVGINELGGNGMGFAIPSNTAARVLKQALAYGKVKRGWLGISVMPVNKLERRKGALVSGVAPGSPAEQAGIKPGDFIMALDGKPTDVRFFEEVPVLYQRIADMRSGTSVTLRLERGGAPKTVTATVGTMRPFTGDEEELRKAGLTVKSITEAMARSHQLHTAEGVLVTGVRTAFPFDTANPRVQEGDVITSIGGKPTPDLAAFRSAVGRLTTKETPVTFYRQDENLVTSVKLPEDKSDEEGGELPKAWVGIKTQVVTPDVAKALGMSGTKGFRITEVYPETQAAKSGLMPGDVITTLNGSKLDASRPQDADDLKRTVEDLDVGTKATFGIIRKGAPKTVEVKLEGTPTSAPQAHKTRQDDFEFAIRDITQMDRMEHRWKKDQPGVLVIDVTAGGWASMAGLRVDDVILAVNGQTITDHDNFKNVMKEVSAKRPKVVSIFLKRGILTHFVFIEPDWKKITASK